MEQVVWNSRFTFIFRQEASSTKMPHELKGKGEIFLEKKSRWLVCVYHAQLRGLKMSCFDAIWSSL